MKRVGLITALGTLLFVSAYAAETQAPAASAATAEKSEIVVKPNDEGCLADAAALEDMRNQKLTLENRLRELEARDADLKAREKAIAEQLKQLEAMREEITKLDFEKRKGNELKVSKIIETLEVMNPKAASNMLATMDEGLAVTAMSKLSTAKLAKVMNVMEPSRSSKLSELLAGVTRAKKELKSVTSEPAKQVASNSMKGGERENGNNNESSVRDEPTSRSNGDTGNPGTKGK
jgi:flagellar motility protein MotE (MotC chaperone)